MSPIRAALPQTLERYPTKTLRPVAYPTPSSLAPHVPPVGRLAIFPENSESGSRTFPTFPSDPLSGSPHAYPAREAKKLGGLPQNLRSRGVRPPFPSLCLPPSFQLQSPRLLRLQRPAALSPKRRKLLSGLNSVLSRKSFPLPASLLLLLSETTRSQHQGCAYPPTSQKELRLLVLSDFPCQKVRSGLKPPWGYAHS